MLKTVTPSLPTPNVFLFPPSVDDLTTSYFIEKTEAMRGEFPQSSITSSTHVAASAVFPSGTVDEPLEHEPSRTLPTCAPSPFSQLW